MHIHKFAFKYKNAPMRIIIIFLLLTFSGTAFSQKTNTPKTSSDSLAILEVKAQKWLKELYEGGIWADSDTIHVSTEFKKLISDSTYRKEVYPSDYTWEKTIELLKGNQIKRSFWNMINLYSLNDKNKTLVLNTMMFYTKAYEVDKIISAAFYTYCYTDPTIGAIKNNKPEILYPNVMENKLNTSNEIIARILTQMNSTKK